MRVAMLLPVIMLTVLLTRSSHEPSIKRPPLLPWFAVVFLCFVAINSFGLVPKPAVSAGATLSSWCLVAAIAALGVKTQLERADGSGTEADRADGRRDYSAGSDRVAGAALLRLTFARGCNACNAASRDLAIRFCQGLEHNLYIAFGNGALQSDPRFD